MDKCSLSGWIDNVGLQRPAWAVFEYFWKPGLGLKSRSLVDAIPRAVDGILNADLLIGTDLMRGATDFSTALFRIGR